MRVQGGLGLTLAQGEGSYLRVDEPVLGANGGAGNPLRSLGTEPAVSNHRLPRKQRGRTEPALAPTLLFTGVKQTLEMPN